MLNKKSLSKYIICIICGVLSTFSLEPYGYLPLMVFFVLGIYIVLKSNNKVQVFFLGMSFGFGWFFSGLYWIGSAFLIKSLMFQIILPFAIILLPIFLGFLWGFAFFISLRLSSIFGNRYVWLIICLSLIELLRGYVLKFPWLMPGYIVSSNLYMLQSFSFVGAYSMNTVVISLMIIPLLLKTYKGMLYQTTIFLFVPIVILFYLSFNKFNNKIDLKYKKDYLITIVQPNISQKQKWDRELFKRHLQKLKELSIYNHKIPINKKRLIIWPETAFAGVYPRDEKLLVELVKKVINKDRNVNLFLGLIRKENKKIYNSSILFNSSLEIEKVYDKNFLVPFGEYNPASFFFNFLPSFASDIDFNKGKTRPKFSIYPSMEFIPLICYEVIFNNYIFDNLSNQTSLIINITNDAWFGDSIGPYQHFKFAKIRAVEFGIPVVRVANTGISALINPYGEILEKIKLNTQDSKTINLVEKLDNTFFKTYGNWIFIFIVFYVFILNTTLFNKTARKLFS